MEEIVKRPGAVKLCISYADKADSFVSLPDMR